MIRSSGKLCLLLGSLVAVVVATPLRAEKLAGEFMAIGPGARALGMGAAFAGVADDASTLYWNPAGISGFEKRQVLFMHSERFGDLVDYNYGAFVNPSTAFVSEDREAAWGISVQHLGIDDIPIANEGTIQYDDVDGDGTFTPGVDRLRNADNLPKETNNDFAFYGTYALRTKFGRVGGSLKLIYTDGIDGVSAAGVGIDLGYLQRDVLTDHLDLGIKLTDATGTYLSWSTGTNEFIVPSVKLGGAYTIPSEGLNGSLLIAADADLFFDDRQNAAQFWTGSVAADLHFGLELRFQDKVMVRGGYDADNPTVGAGFFVNFIGFDYAYLHDTGDDFDGTHRISALAEF